MLVLAVGVGLAVAGIAVALSFLHTTPVANVPPPNDQPPSPGTKPPPTPSPGVTPVPGVSLVRNDAGVQVKTAKYEAVLGTDGCLTSLTAGGVELLRPGEPLFNGKSIARGAYFYFEKPPHQGVVQMSQIEQPAGNIVKASGDKFSVTYEFTPDAVHLKAANATDDRAPFFVVLDSVPVAEVVNDRGEHWTVPAGAPPDAKWATTTWKAGRSALTIRRTDGGDVRLWGPFGKCDRRSGKGTWPVTERPTSCWNRAPRRRRRRRPYRRAACC